MRNLLIHILFIAATLGAGIFAGTQWQPGAWYEGLQQPFFTPPDSWFPIVWSVLYVLIGWVGARMALYGGPAVLWILQIALNLSWTPVFFGAHEMVIGLSVIAALWVVILAFILRAWSQDKLSSLLFVPYLAWISIATALNASLVLLN
ncbi:TspO/MBR family protein [Falsirhodobacter sp. alg1]|uniref:TspO/MBR family protein n=1 Tax=Falsirhodobacter sp. alg1 TaxID=1472418 RepID=UPI0005EDC6C4|nr:TspO/MBR family protein [Falsirhodobacter sp. alg1]